MTILARERTGALYGSSLIEKGSKPGEKNTEREGGKKEERENLRNTSLE